MQSLQKLLQEESSFTIRLENRDWSPIAFQEQFWKILNYVDKADVKWSTLAEAKDTFQTNAVLHYMRTRGDDDGNEISTVILDFQVREYNHGEQYDEEPQEFGVVLEDVYSVAWHTDESDNDYLMTDFEEFQNDYEPPLTETLDMSQLLLKYKG